MMKITELRQKSKEELINVMAEKRARIDELRFLLHQKKVKNVKETAHARKDIARIQTVIRMLRT
ncbi:MAG: 50S ribosomal protein L29 [Candidatus Sungbacteria bacterium]|nr:50S ribosomal protein L29 [bacterium]MDZ4285648.1 50S ribosomal protein L29 [Candidatus Sungbacteria bacterium]